MSKKRYSVDQVDQELRAASASFGAACHVRVDLPQGADMMPGFPEAMTLAIIGYHFRRVASAL